MLKELILMFTAASLAKPGALEYDTGIFGIGEYALCIGGSAARRFASAEE